MSDGGVFTALVTAAVSVAALHTLAPDHWAPFAAVARARGWSAGRTARVTLLCGFGHVTASALLGLLALFFGLGVLQSVGKRMEALAGLLLIAFGLIYAAWGLRRTAGAHFHGHVHHHYDHVHQPERTTVWSLILLFSADPCVAVMPILFAAAPLGAVRTTAIVLLYEAATLATMVLLVLPARAGVKRLRFRFLDKYGDATAGGAIAAVGLAVMLLGW